MFATAIRCSKASRRPLTSKKANKDFYKGTRQAYLPGGRRTGAPGAYTARTGRYKLDDEKVRVYVAPTIEVLSTTPLKPYVPTDYKLAANKEAERAELKKIGIVNSGTRRPGELLLRQLDRPKPDEALILGPGAVPAIESKESAGKSKSTLLVGNATWLESAPETLQKDFEQRLSLQHDRARRMASASLTA